MTTRRAPALTARASRANRPALAALALSLAACASAHPAPAGALPATPPVAAAAPLPPVTGLPPAERWVTHLQEELMPFWMVPDAWGEPRGNFPTVRCNDGRRVDPARPCREVRYAADWMRADLGKTFVRMQSRQAFAYGVAFHLTGDPRYLALARDGVAWIRAHALDADGSAVTWFEGDRAGPAALERTAQDLAYAAVGLAMYYHLTRDEAVLHDLLRLQEHVFGRYWRDDWGMLAWVVRDPAGGPAGEALRQELVAQLDQVNAYLLLVTPLLPEPHRTRWSADLRRVARVLLERYWSPEERLFWGTLQDGGRALEARHVDFGHTAKALWMLDRIGRLTGDAGMVAFADREGADLLRRAYLPGTGSWASRPVKGGGVDPDKSWWISAELDQLAATLALGDHDLAPLLARTYPYWLGHFVDRDGGEVWGSVSDRTGESLGGLKIHPWKSGYHSTEHALVAYLTTRALTGEPATLYFALADPRADVRPYLFGGEAQRRALAPLEGFPGLSRVEVTFAGLR